MEKPALVKKKNSDLDPAEESLLESIEERRGRVRAASGEVYRTAVAGERPLLLGNVSLEQMYHLYDGRKDDDDQRQASSGDSPSPTPSKRFKDIALKVMKKNNPKDKFVGVVHESLKRRNHKRSQTQAQTLLENINEEADPALSSKASGFFQKVAGQDIEMCKSQFALKNTQVDRLVKGAMQVEKLLEQDEDDSTVGSQFSTDEQLPLLDVIPDSIDTTSAYGSSSNRTSVAQQLQQSRANRRRRKWYKKLAHKVARCCNPVKFGTFFKNMLVSMYFTAIALVFFLLALMFFYLLGNPKFDFMPGPPTLSWWCNFIGRQLLTLDLARATQYILIDGLLLGSKYTVQFLGPLVTLWALQAKGWPLITLAWGIWDLLLLHGDSPFQTHWLYWTGIAIYSKANSGSYILTSSLYLRFLLSFILAGAVTSLKRALVAIYFGRRTFTEFKPRLEKILKDIVLLNEVADLAEEAERLTSEIELSPSASSHKTTRKMLGATVTWEDDLLDSDAPLVLERESSASERSTGRESQLERESSASERSTGRESLSRSPSGSFRIKDLLDRWKEPINKLEKTTDASISDILRFRHALAFMDEDKPFGSSFGEASTRDECIESAHRMYMRLLRLTPDSQILSNDAFSMLAQDDDGFVNTSKQSALRRLFRPDRLDQIPMLAFIQSVDTLYRNLRYFRASVGNASVIDHALERMLDSAFGFFLFLIILTILNIDPWPLLVSLSTVLVSLSFAMGSSASKYIEGVLLISLRRPFDLGDRIVFTTADLVTNPGAGNSWLIEDINLNTTTLRYALTNEVATISNGNLAGTRIVNLNRSPNAICTVDITMHLCIIENDKVEIYKNAIDNYIMDHPRAWEALAGFRFNSFDSDNESCSLRLSVRHRNSWQDTPRVLRDFGEFQCFVFKLGDTMEVNFDSPPARRLLYQGGTLVNGKVEDYKRNLLQPRNIRSSFRSIGDDESTGEPKRYQDKNVSDALFLAQVQKANKGS